MAPPVVRSLPAPASRWRIPAIALLLAYFCYFCWDSALVRFAPDDLMNMAYYLKQKPLELLLAQLTPWKASYRPMAGLYYVPILDAFGLNPVPFHVVTLLLLLANVYLLYRLARQLGAGELAAGLAALLACYHAGLSNLGYDTAFIFDVLCCLFYLAALVYYIGIRSRERLLNLRQSAAFLGLYLCALNSKEMAVTLPAVLLVYEWFFHRPGRLREEWRAWLFGPGRAALMAAAVDLVYLYGKVLRPDALMQIEGYRPVLSLQRFLDFQILSWSDLLLTWNRFGWRTVLGICIVLSFFAWRLRRPVLRFCWLFFLIAPLPIEFLVGRTGACLAIPFCGLAIFVAVTFVGLTRALANLLRWRLCREIVFALICLSALALWARQNHTVKQLYVKPAMDETGRETWAVIEQLRSLDPHIRPRSSVVFLNDPFEGYDMAFIAEAFFRDPSLVIRLGRKTPISQQELAAADYLFTFDGGSLVRLR